MSRTLYPILKEYPHLHVKDTELGMLYDCLGGHAKKQEMLGSGTHYSKLKVDKLASLNRSWQSK